MSPVKNRIKDIYHRIYIDTPIGIKVSDYNDYVGERGVRTTKRSIFLLLYIIIINNNVIILLLLF